MGAVTSSVRDQDRGAREVVRRMADAGKQVVKVGIFGDAASETKEGRDETGLATNVEVASFHEFGLGNNPERSFIRATVDDSLEEIKELQRKVGKGILQRRFSEAQGLGIIGAFVQAEIQKRIQAGIPPDLTDATKDRKGSSTPLIDTGQLIQSIAWEVASS